MTNAISAQEIIEEDKDIVTTDSNEVIDKIDTFGEKNRIDNLNINDQFGFNFGYEINDRNLEIYLKKPIRACCFHTIIQILDIE